MCVKTEPAAYSSLSTTAQLPSGLPSCLIWQMYWLTNQVLIHLSVSPFPLCLGLAVLICFIYKAQCVHWLLHSFLTLCFKNKELKNFCREYGKAGLVMSSVFSQLAQCTASFCCPHTELISSGLHLGEKMLCLNKTQLCWLILGVSFTFHTSVCTIYLLKPTEPFWTGYPQVMLVRTNCTVTSQVNLGLFSVYFENGSPNSEWAVQPQTAGGGSSLHMKVYSFNFLHK